MNNKKIKLALTMGDPAGIGPELALKAIKYYQNHNDIEIALYGDEDVIFKNADMLGFKFSLKQSLHLIKTGNLQFKNIKLGKINPKCGMAALNAIKKATMDTLNGITDAIVTTPVSKASINMAGISFTGHTEFIANLCSCKSFAMMQSSDNLRIAFVTTHIPLRAVPDSITQNRIFEVTKMLFNAIKAEGIKKPKIAIAALNPHAGENGYMGMEDEKIVKPTIELLKKTGMKIDGPFPPDTLFLQKTLAKYDGIISMYHDQGHIPFKMLAFDKGVNSTLGLPIIRTSVDHGTAFNIAGQGQADTGSLFAAINLAITRALA